MEIIKKIEIRSTQARFLMERKMKNGGSFVVAALVQVGQVYRLAKQEYLYPYILLLNISAQISKVREVMQKIIKDFEKALVSRKIDSSKFEAPVKETYEVRIGNPLIGEIVNLIEQYDRLSLLLCLTNNLNLFRGEQHFYIAANKNSRRVLEVFKNCLGISRKQTKMKSVTISHYLQNDSAYLEIKDVMGEIRPAVLFSALNLAELPKLRAERRNIIFEQLRKL